MLAIELWYYTFPWLHPHPLRLVSYECTATMARVIGPKRFFPEQNHCFRGSCRGNFEDSRNLNQPPLLLILFLALFI